MQVLLKFGLNKSWRLDQLCFTASNDEEISHTLFIFELINQNR